MLSPAISLYQTTSEVNLKHVPSVFQSDSNFYNKSGSKNITGVFSLNPQEITFQFIKVPSAFDNFTDETHFLLNDSTFQLIELANHLFAQSQPLDSTAAEILEFTFNRLRSKSPTRLL